MTFSTRLRKLFSSVRPSSRKRQERPSFHPKIEVLEDRLAPATFAWTGQGGGNNFSNPANWNNIATNTIGSPGNGDSLIFPLNGPTSPGTITDDIVGTTNFASITFLSAGWTIAAAAGSTVGITGPITDSTSIAGTNTFTAPLSFAAATSSVGISVVNPTGTANNLLQLTGTVALGNAGFTFTGFGNLLAGGVVSGAGAIVANSSGTITLSGANTYTGGTTITSGIIDPTNAAGLGTGTTTVHSGGTLQLGVTGIANALNLNGLGFGGNGALTTTGNFTYDGAITLQSSSSINLNTNNLMQSQIPALAAALGAYNEV